MQGGFSMDLSNPFFLNPGALPTSAADAPAEDMNHVLEQVADPTQWAPAPTAGTEPPVNATDPSNANPAPKPETPQEKAWYQKALDWTGDRFNEMGQAVQDPGEGLKGVAKEMMNTPAGLWNAVILAGTVQAGSDLQQGAMFTGGPDGDKMMQLGQDMTQNPAKYAAPGMVEEPFKMSNPAQQGGADIFNVASIPVGSGAKALLTGAKAVGKLGRGANLAANTAKDVGELGGAAHPAANTAKGVGELEGKALVAKDRMVREGGGKPISFARTLEGGQSFSSVPDPAFVGPNAYSHLHVVDSQGRTVGFQGRLFLDPYNVRSKSAQARVSKPFRDAGAEVDASHVAARQHGGIPGEENLVPLAEYVNRKQIGELEDFMTDRLKQGDPTFLVGKANYAGSTRIPQTVTYDVYGLKSDGMPYKVRSETFAGSN